MNKIILIPLFLALLSTSGFCYNIVSTPNQFSPTVNISSVTDYTMMLNNTELGTNATNVSFKSAYYGAFNPDGFNLMTFQYINFRLFAPNVTGAYTDNITIYVNGVINKVIPANFFVENQTELDAGDFFYTKCYWYEGSVKCSPIDPDTEFNETVLNVTNITENRYYAFPEQFFNNFSQFLTENMEKYQSIEDIVQKTLSASATISENAWTIEAILKNEEYPLWMQMTPVNELINITGMSDTDFYNAIGKLAKEQRISQYTETRQVEQLVGNAVMISEKQFTFVASTERVNLEEQRETLWHWIIGFTVIIIISVGSALFYFMYYRKKPRFGGGLI